MASNISYDQQRLIGDGDDNPPSYQDPPNLGIIYFSFSIKREKYSRLFQGKHSYGTYPGSIGGPPPTTTTVSNYPYALGYQQPTIIILGGCPACKVRVYFMLYLLNDFFYIQTGMLETDFTFLGLCCAIFFFPIGILCCLAFRQRRCNFCGAIYD